MAGWKKSKRALMDEPTLTPKDNIKYSIPFEVIKVTESVLKEYGSLSPSSEGMVYWAGMKEGTDIKVLAVIAPYAKATRHNVQVDHYANMEVVDFIIESSLIHLGQVHTHPGEWVGHSAVDDDLAAFRCNGLLSLVVPNFCSSGMLPLSMCGVHRYEDGKFDRLSNTYVNQHFEVCSSVETITFKDFRNDHQ